MNRRVLSLVVVLGLALVGCPRPGGVSGPGGSAVEAVRQAPPHYALKADATLKVDAKALGIAGSTKAALVVHRPSELLAQVSGPMGGILMELVLNRDTVSIRMPQKGITLQGRDPDGVVRALTGDAFGVDALLALLTGRLPDQGLEALTTERAGDLVQAQLALGAPGASWQALITVDSRQKTLKNLVIKGQDGRDRLQMAWSGVLKVGRDKLPEQIDLQVPDLGLKASIRVRAWDALGQIPDVFRPPESGLVVTTDLVEKIKGWRARTSP